jgi:hypothetical protein
MWKSLAVAFLFAVACATAPAPPASAPAPRPPPAAAKTLSPDACDALARWILDACHDRGNDRAARTEGWCSDVERRTLPDDRSWIRDCAAHVTEIDEACFRSTNGVHNLMDCDSAVSRP